MSQVLLFVYANECEQEFVAFNSLNYGNDVFHIVTLICVRIKNVIKKPLVPRLLQKMVAA